jgi:hypothetical protein
LRLASVSDGYFSGGVLENPPAVFSGGGYTVEQFTQLTEADTGYQAFLSPLFQARGRVREFELNSNLGPALLLGQDGVDAALVHGEKGAVAEALSRAYQAMLNADFPPELTAINFPWRIVLLNGIPRPLHSSMLSSSQCHAAWMGPPATIVVALDRLNPRCYGQMGVGRSKKDALIGILLHEIGHAVEFRLMGRSFGRRQRWHSEGFAQWFELFVSGSLKGDDVLAQQKKSQASRSYNARWRGELFRGTKKDYLASWSYFSAMVESHGLEGLFAVYQLMDEENLSFSEAAEKQLGLNQLVWGQAVAEFLAR